MRHRGSGHRRACNARRLLPTHLRCATTRSCQDQVSAAREGAVPHDAPMQDIVYFSIAPRTAGPLALSYVVSIRGGMVRLPVQAR